MQKQGNAVPNVDQKSESSNPVNCPLLNRTKLNEENDCYKKEQNLKIDAYMLKYVMIINNDKSSLPRKNSQKNLECNYVDDENVNLDFLAICA